MKILKQFVHLFFMAGLLFATMIACDKSDDLDGDNQSAGKIKDVDGNVYKTVKIGTQIWMAENLKTTKYNDGTPIPNITDLSEWFWITTGAYCNYDNLESNAAIYGRLYNWYAVNTGKLAPEGWHVATYEDWSTLLDYVKAHTGTSRTEAKALAASTNWNFTSAGDIGYDLEKNNTTGFSALPGGARFTLDYGFIGSRGVWWSSTEYSANEAWGWYMFYDKSSVSGESYYKDWGISVRCVKDN